MRVGLSAYNLAADDLVALCTAADELGFSSVWLGEHLVLPIGYGSEHPTAGTTTHAHHKGPIIDPNTILIDPLVALAGAAVATKSLRLATGIYLLPLRHPLVTARAVATLDSLAPGRITLGVGSGWLREEFDALGAEFASRRARFEESIDVLRAAWAGGPFEHRGAQYSFDPVQVCAAPIDVRLVLGGNTEPALRRAARVADGWFSSGTPSLDDACRLRDELMRYRSNGQARAKSFTIHVRSSADSAAELARYEAEGFDEVVLWADRFWPAHDSDHSNDSFDSKRRSLTAAATRLGIAHT